MKILPYQSLSTYVNKKYVIYKYYLYMQTLHKTVKMTCQYDDIVNK